MSARKHKKRTKSRKQCAKRLVARLNHKQLAKREAARRNAEKVGAKAQRRPRTVFRRSIDLDYGALSTTGYNAWSRLIEAFVDWIENRSCSHSLERQLRGPCAEPDELAKRVRQAIWRHNHTIRALDQVHDACIDEGRDPRMGAVSADGCLGCVYSYPGPTEPDVGLLEVFRPTARDALRVNGRLKGKRVRFRLPPYETRARQLPQREHAPDWSNYPFGACQDHESRVDEQQRLRMYRIEHEGGDEACPHLSPR